jgi:hypothetical protein
MRVENHICVAGEQQDLHDCITPDAGFTTKIPNHEQCTKINQYGNSKPDVPTPQCHTCN